MPFRLVIFDCDGVMFDSRPTNEAFYNHIRAHFELAPLTPGELDYVHMATMVDSIDSIMPDERLRDQAHAFLKTIDFTPFLRLMAMEPHLVDVLRFLKPRFKTAVATNRSQSIHLLLKEFHLREYFDLVISCLDVTRPKPDPEAVLTILNRLDVAPSEALYVGDSEIDVGTARGAGVRLAILNNPHLPADYHIPGLDRIKAIVDGE